MKFAFSINSKTLIASIVALLIVAIPVSAREVAYEDVGFYDVSFYTVEDLVAKGCQVVAPTIESSPNTAGRLGVVNIPDGMHAQGLRSLTNQSNFDPGYEFTGSIGTYFYSFTFCPPAVFEQIINDPIAGSSVGAQPMNSFEIAAINLINWLLWMSAQIGTWLLWASSKLLGYVLGARYFITNPLVQNGWPFVQGLANVGFIIALLYIAAATTLRLDIGGSVKRLLPRLLIAALLINFSLVISGLITDISRLLMAVIVTISGEGSLTNIGATLLASSDAIQGVFDTGSLSLITLNAEPTNWQIPLQVLQATILIWALALGVFIVTAGLVMRYIILILLLIVSPLAYLAFAFPGAQKWAMQWWEQFMKWVLYGPIALFVLLLLAELSTSGRNILNQGVGHPFLESILAVGITSAMCIAAVKAASSLGGIGGSAVINFATNQGKKAAYYGSGAALAAAGGRYAAGAAKEGVKSQYKRTGIPDYLEVRRKSIDKAKKKAEEERKENSTLRKLAERQYNPKKAQKADDAKAVSAKYEAGAYQGKSQLHNAPELSLGNLADGDFVSNLSGDLLARLAEHGNTGQQAALVAGIGTSGKLAEGQVNALVTTVMKTGDTRILDRMVNNVEIVKNMNDQQKAQVIQVATAKGDKNATKDLFKTMANIKKKEDDDGKKKKEDKK